MCNTKKWKEKEPFLKALAPVSAFFLSACRESLSYEEASAISGEIKSGKIGDGTGIIYGMLDGISGQIASVYMAVHPYIIIMIAISWVVMLLRIIFEHESRTKLKVSIVGFGIVIPLILAWLDIGCGLYLSWNAAGGMPEEGQNLFLLTAQGIHSCAPVFIVSAVFILVMGIVYLLLGQKTKTSWKSFGFSLLIDFVLILLVVISGLLVK